MTPPFDMLESMRLAAILVGIGMLISTLELLSLRRHFGEGGLYAGSVMRMRRGLDAAGGGAMLDRVFSAELMTLALAIRIVSILTMMGFAVAGSLHLPSIAVLVATQLFHNYRNCTGNDGSDQMSSVVSITLLIFAIDPTNPLSTQACLWFLGLQSILSYMASGGAKLISPRWRSGTPLYEVLNTRTYGLRTAAAFLAKHPRLGKVLSYSVIAAQISFILVLFIPWPFNLVYVAWALAFHWGIAFLMGLNIFPWPFAANYPALIWCAFQVQSVIWA